MSELVAELTKRGRSGHSGHSECKYCACYEIDLLLGRNIDRKGVQ